MFFFSSRRRHTRYWRDWSSDVCSSDLIFSRVLDGTAVQDLFIVPSREERLHDKQPDAEYGTTLRIFNPKTMAWDIFYSCMGEAILLTEIGRASCRERV